jgi:hypothetical protein
MVWPCEVCGWDDFVRTEYECEVGRVPALECARCHAINLSEDAARTEEERTSVRMAIAVREAICAGPYPQ